MLTLVCFDLMILVLLKSVFGRATQFGISSGTSSNANPTLRKLDPGCITIVVFGSFNKISSLLPFAVVKFEVSLTDCKSVTSGVLLEEIF